MVDSTSRYKPLTVYDAIDADARPAAGIPIRLIGPPAPDLLRHRMSGVETLEWLAWRYFRNSTFWWRIADVNGARFPLDWRPGETVNMPRSGDVGLLQRSRSF